MSILNDILDLSKIEAGKVVPRCELVSTQILLNEIGGLFKDHVKKKGLLFAVEIKKGVPLFIMADKARIRQILFNIIGNAVKFTGKGGITLTLDKEAGKDDMVDLIFSVEDTGVGIPKDQFGYIFESFNKHLMTETAKYGGIGLLSLSKHLAEMMGGKISVKSKVGEGSIFTVYIPNVKMSEEHLIYTEDGTAGSSYQISSGDESSMKETQSKYEIIEEKQKIDPNLIKILENKFLPVLNDLSRKQVMNEIYKFATDLFNLGKSMSCKTLSAYASDLRTSADSFDIDKISKTLKFFPYIINSIKSHQKS